MERYSPPRGRLKWAQACLAWNGCCADPRAREEINCVAEKQGGRPVVQTVYETMYNPRDGRRTAKWRSADRPKTTTGRGEGSARAMPGQLHTPPSLLGRPSHVG
jgi:hypothetical protein